MAGVVLLARETGRAGRAAAALGWTATILLLADPGLVGDAGLQLSTLATAGLIAWATPLTDRIDRLGRGRLPRWLTENLGVSLAAQAATLPLILASFGRLAVISPLVNLVVVPLVAPAMAAGIVAMAGGLVVGAGGPSVVGAVLAAPAWVSAPDHRDRRRGRRRAAGQHRARAGDRDGASVVVLVIGGAARHAVTHRRRSGPDGRAARIATLPGLVSLLHPRRTRPIGCRAWVGHRARVDRRVTQPPRDRRRCSVGSPSSRSWPVLVAGAVVVARPAGVARITVLDVGQGDAILVEGSRGGRLLVDGGPSPDRLLVVLDRTAAVGPADRCDRALASARGPRRRPGTAPRALSGPTGLRARHARSRAGLRGLARAARPTGAPDRLGLVAGDRLRVDEIAMTVLWPIRGHVPIEPPDGGTGINNVSIVLLGSR